MTLATDTSAATAPVDCAQVRRAVAADRLPDYAETMAAFHRAYAPELRRMIADVWPAGGHRALDLACGDGCYSVWLAEQAGESAEIWAVDVSRDWLNVARRSSRRVGLARQVRMIAADALTLPFEEGLFDFVWCAQSLYSLPSPDKVLRELYRVLRPGGRLALLENDTLHQLLFPWGAELELKVRGAEQAETRRRSRHPDKFYIGRKLGEILWRTGFVHCHKRTYATDREGPLAGDVRTFVAGYLNALRSWIESGLASNDLAAFDRLLTPGANGCILDDAHITITSLDHVVWGEKPA